MNELQTSSALVRPWTLNDLPAIQHVYLTTWLDAYTAFIPERDLHSYFEEHYNLQALTALYQHPESKGFVAVLDATVIGFVRTFFEKDEQHLYVHSLYVLPGFQGRGIGNELMRAAESLAPQYDVHEVWLGVMKENVKTVKWYETMGFRWVREEPFRMGQTVVLHLIGFRKLADPT